MSIYNERIYPDTEYEKALSGNNLILEFWGGGNNYALRDRVTQKLVWLGTFQQCRDFFYGEKR